MRDCKYHTQKNNRLLFGQPGTRFDVVPAGGAADYFFIVKRCLGTNKVIRSYGDQFFHLPLTVVLKQAAESKLNLINKEIIKHFSQVCYCIDTKIIQNTTWLK